MFDVCCSCCNPSPESRADILAQEILESTNHQYHELLHEIIIACRELKSLRHTAKSFTSMYGPWFRRFTPPHKFMEPLLLLHMVLLCLTVGLLQHFPKIQATTAALLSLMLTLYLAVINPFNETSRYWFEVIANTCMTGAFMFVAVHQFVEYEDTG